MKLRKLIDGLKDRFRPATAQTTTEYALVLSVISGTSVFLNTNLSGQVANAVINVARLLP